MDMRRYWNALTNKFTPAQAAKAYPHEVKCLLLKLNVADVDEIPGEFAFDLYPSWEPGGPFSDEDETRGLDEDPLPTVTGSKGLFYYDTRYDELYDFCPNRDDVWLMWNY